MAWEHTQPPYSLTVAEQPNGPEGSIDVAIRDSTGCIIGEAFQIVGPGERRPAVENARLWAGADELLKACSLLDIYGREAEKHVSVRKSDAILDELLANAIMAARDGVALATGKVSPGHPLPPWILNAGVFGSYPHAKLEDGRSNDRPHQN